MLKSLKATIWAAIAVALLASSTVTMAANPANDTWKELKQLIFKERTINQANGEIDIIAPYRAVDDRIVPVTIMAAFKDGRTVKKITFIIEENPMPVSAVFDMKKQRRDAKFSTVMRLNGPSTLRAIVEANDGSLYMIRKFVKTSGLGACAAPPIGDPDQLLVGLGQMKLQQVSSAEKKLQSSQIKRAAHLKIKHPNLTGLQMDQITLRYILARFVTKIEVAQGDEPLFTVTGSISFSENPELTFDYLYNGADKISVHMVDTSGAEFTEEFPMGLGS